MCGNTGEAYSHFIPSGPGQRMRSGIRMGHAQEVIRPVGPGKDVTDCYRVRTMSLEAGHLHTRRSVHPIRHGDSDDDRLDDQEAMNEHLCARQCCARRCRAGAIAGPKR